MSKVQRKIRRALNDSQLNEAVLKASELSTQKRNIAVSEIAEYEEARDSARAARQKSIDNAPALIDQFTSNFEKHGGKVHHARNANEGCLIIDEILLKSGARRGVKSKSMVTEEIELREYLTHIGYDVVESDLGEFIVQLAGEPPSHITAPALHRSRQSIGKLFEAKLGVEYTEDPTELTMIARKALREKFCAAEFGVAGSNFLIAETGQVVVVENEGNARLGMAVPKVFIAVTGIEKTLPEKNDLAPLLNLLSRSATGQRLTSYVNIFKPENQSNRKREFHVVLIDNGRTRALKDPILREMMLCIRCGACLNVCPVYRSIGGHAYDSIYPGPMGAILSNLLGESPMRHCELPHLSTLCGLCKDVCPVRIDIPKLLLELRARCDKPVYQKIAAGFWRWTMDSPKRFETMESWFNIAAQSLPEKLSQKLKLSKTGAFRSRFEYKK